MQTFQCTLQLDRVLPEMLEWCPLLRTLTIDLNSESNLGQRQDLDDDLDNLRHWFLSGRPLDQGTEFFWLFQEAWIRIEIGSPKFPSHAGEVIIPKAQQPLHEVLLCDLETKWVRDWNENEVWEAAYDAAMTGGWVSSKGNAGRDPRGKMVGWTQTGREIWRQTCRKWAIKATR